MKPVPPVNTKFIGCPKVTSLGDSRRQLQQAFMRGWHGRGPHELATELYGSSPIVAGMVGNPVNVGTIGGYVGRGYEPPTYPTGQPLTERSRLAVELERPPEPSI
jgi:hypothetical protein